MSTVASSVGKFVWHEQVSSDPQEAQGFYTQLFGWETEVFKPGDADYTMISSGGSAHGGYGTAMEGAPPPHWLSHVHVDNVAISGFSKGGFDIGSWDGRYNYYDTLATQGWNDVQITNLYSHNNGGSGPTCHQHCHAPAAAADHDDGFDYRDGRHSEHDHRSSDAEAGRDHHRGHDSRHANR